MQVFQDLLQGLQTNRLLTLSFPHDDSPAAQLVPNKLHAYEAISRDFDYTVELLSNDASLSLKDLQGKLLCVELVRADGTLRYFTGYVFSFRRKRTDGAIVFYEARLAPWLAYLKLRKDNYLFHGQTARADRKHFCRLWDAALLGQQNYSGRQAHDGCLPIR